MLSTNIRRLFPAMLITNLTITHYVATLDFFKLVVPPHKSAARWFYVDAYSFCL